MAGILRFGLACSLLVGAFAPGWVETASAQDNTLITAQSYKPVEEDGRIMVVPRTESDLNLRLAQILESELTAAGYRVGAGDVTWFFETEFEPDPGTAPPVELFGSYGSRRGGEDLGARLRLPLVRRSADVRGARFRMIVEIRTAVGDLAWAAAISSIRRNLDRFEVGRLMAQQLVFMVGDSVEREPIALN